jgi:ribose 5-phosphate isomerase B
MTKEKIFIACDHGGTVLKDAIKKAFAHNYDWIDLGADGSTSVDYPDYANKLADAMAQDKVSRGVLICGSGIGISIAANRHGHIRCALCTDVTMARLSREHNHANVVALGERLTGAATALDIVETFLNTDIDSGERHARRVAKLVK